MPYKIPFNRPFLAGKELENIAKAVNSGHIAGNGMFTRKCQEFLEKKFGCPKVLMTNSCTAALEMAAMLCDVRPGDEVILPSFTFVSTANAFVLRGGRPVFVDIRADTLNLDESLIARAVTRKTKVICPVHYAGVGCAMDAVMKLAGRHGLRVVEDAALAFGATYKGRPLGTFGCLGTLSFHETKHVISGEGGALLINDAALRERAEIIWEKGTDRSKFLRGEVDKYSWVDVGSSFLPPELVTAFLFAQLQKAGAINAARLKAWRHYYECLEDLHERGALRLPVVPPECGHNGHLFYVLMNSENDRDRLIGHLKDSGIHAVFHYVPLHLSAMGRKMGYRAGDLPVTEELSSRLVRLPLFHSITRTQQTAVVKAVRSFLK
jgi:dTDP-4-amino-4,6-dideoxygalactose transaminase